MNEVDEGGRHPTIGPVSGDHLACGLRLLGFRIVGASVGDVLLRHPAHGGREPIRIPRLDVLPTVHLAAILAHAGIDAADLPGLLERASAAAVATDAADDDGVLTSQPMPRVRHAQSPRGE